MTPANVRAAVEEALRPGCFFVARPMRLRVERMPFEQLPWEIFLGHLLDPALARETGEFEVWNLFLDDDQTLSGAPLISIKWQPASGRLHIVRQVLTYGFEAYEGSPGVILSRPVQKWVAELLGTIETHRFDSEILSGELAQYLFLAVIGSSRLPVTSIESPLPAFSLGELAYLPKLTDLERPEPDSIEFLRRALADDRLLLEQAKALEIALRAIDAGEVPRLADLLQASYPPGSRAGQIGRLLREVFNSVALSPYTGFVERLISTLLELASPQRLGVAPIVDLVGYMLRQLCRHLTAFDLTLFHNFGANYPDALFLDALLKAYLKFVEVNPELFLVEQDDDSASVRDKRLRRRAFRQASLVRRQYEGHRVPDAPTSMGENARVLPAPYARVPEEQILQVVARHRALFKGDPFDVVLSNEVIRRVHQETVADLSVDSELSELGMAYFLDRPFGILKQPGEVDRTPLVSYEAFSRFVTKRRVAQVKSYGWIDEQHRQTLLAQLQATPTGGVPVASLAPLERPGVVSLADALKVAADFVLLRTTRQSRRDLLAVLGRCEFGGALDEIAGILASAELIVPARDLLPDGSTGQATIRGYNREGRLLVELGFAPASARMSPYFERGGVEFPCELHLIRREVHELPT